MSENTHQTDMFHTGEVPKMPEGYYSGDKPNPNLRKFVEEHLKEKPYDPENDDYDVKAFDTPIESTKATAIYNMHTYWSKKPHDAIREYIRHYTKKGDLVLDPFCGSGGTALAALMEGRKAIAIDRSPAATFITKNYCTPVDVAELKQAFEELKRKVKPEIDWLYETKCDRCGGKATTAYTVYSQVFECPRCMARVALFDCVEVKGETATGKEKSVSVCPNCKKRGIDEEISTRAKKYGSKPVMVSYLCENGCKPARGERRHNDESQKKRENFEKYDLGKLREIEEKEIPHWYPKHRMMNVEDDTTPWGMEWREGRNFRTVAELFTKRNLWALASILASAKSYLGLVSSDALVFACNAILLNCSNMYRYRSNLKGGFQAGTYYIPQDMQIINVWRAFEDKNNENARQYVSKPFGLGAMISTQSASNVSLMLSDSADYIFTDPPYADKVQYGELNFIWEAWLDFDTRWHDEEIIVNPIRGKTEKDWADMMRKAMSECYRVLKPGRWLSLCYHDTSEGTWSLVQDIMAEAGFLVDSSESALFIDTKQKSYNQLVADKVNKRDLVINFRKPRPGELTAKITITGTEDSTSFSSKVHTIIRDYLTSHPGATKDRIYDDLVSRMVRSGQMEAHNFEELLSQVAIESREEVKKDLFTAEDPNIFGTHEISRWYLKETELAITDTAETEKEEDGARHIASFIVKQIKTIHSGAEIEKSTSMQGMSISPDQIGIHYSDIFEHYIYAVKDKPRRQLSEWLLDYFYKTDEGTYRLPATEEEAAAKSEGRSKGTNRRVKRYLALLEQGAAIPDTELPNDATLCEWIRHCKRAGSFEQGKILYEKGGLQLDSLSEEQQVEVEEDYQVCVRVLSREAKDETGKAKRKTRKKA
jgi:DNA modification methylase